MEKTARRTARACERCRKTRRRCEPPYPCRQCKTAGVECDVRTKARPQRHRRDQSVTSSAGETRPRTRSPIAVATFTTSRPAGPKAQVNTFELLKKLVQDLLSERHGYTFECTLAEPMSCGTEDVTSLLSSATPFQQEVPGSLDPTRTWELLTAFRKFVGWGDAGLVDIESLQATAQAHAGHLGELFKSGVSRAITKHGLPVDALTLLFVALALGAVATGETRLGRSYFHISTEATKQFAGSSTLELCLALFLQHTFALRAGTSNYAHGILMQAIQNAQDLEFDRNTHGVQGLELYLIILMADQYCSLTHNTKPSIQMSQQRDEIFAPLTLAKPQLQTLVDLVAINGYLIEHSQQLVQTNDDDLQILEAMIGKMCSQQLGPMPERTSNGTFRSFYEPLARVHMLCCRLNLRAPSVSKQESWLPSLCICIHAAASILSTYLQLYRPALESLAAHNSTSSGDSRVGGSCTLPPTWRQVKRIMLSVFVIIFAYWHGEMVRSEAARYLAMARILLEYPRWRWGDKLDEALSTIEDISALGGFHLEEHVKTLLPGVGEQFPRPVGSVSETKLNDIPPRDVAIEAPGSWPYDFSVDGLADPFIGTIEDQTLFALWESIECPIDSGFRL